MKHLAQALREHHKTKDYWSLLVIEETHEEFQVRKGVERPPNAILDRGALITVMSDGSIGYASTQDLSPSGITRAYEQAKSWATRFKDSSLLKGAKINFGNNQGRYQSTFTKPTNSIDISQRMTLLTSAEKILRDSKEVIDTEASLWSIKTVSQFYNSEGADIEQEIHRTVPSLSVTALHNDIAQTRTLGGMRALCQQGGFEHVLNVNLEKKAQELVKDAVDLAHAPNCPTETMDILIDPDQMMLQIHESIGHPLELDRILGDERNYAGTSFVTLDMFGKFQYGSKLLNVTFDPTIREEFASYAFDDEGQKASKEFLIKDGLLVRPLGGAVAQARAGMPGVANARVSSWNRPPIDRMANLNIEPGDSTFADMLASIDNGIYVKSNSSWSIDDSRNKFQFGCEWGQLIEKGRLTKVVRNPNYRGISASFWRSLKMVGEPKTSMVMGSPFCGKGEPNQVIRVGHASPVCLFSNVEVFGGE